MSVAHNKDRYGEIWPQQRIDAALVELDFIRPWVTLSGGWAWHFMSPAQHVELKHAHDHKDIDLFVAPEHVGLTVSKLKQRGFQRVWTKYDRLPSKEDFRRYEKTLLLERTPVRITVDFFVRKYVPYRIIENWQVVEPRFLLGLYRDIHSSDKCFAVQAAFKLLAKGIDPVGRQELVAIPS